MPEGDTVYLAATRLRAALAGQRLTGTEFRLPQLATADLAGQTMVDVTPVGKHLFLRTDARVTLHTHFRMQGSLAPVPAGAEVGAALFRRPGGAAHRAVGRGRLPAAGLRAAAHRARSGRR